MKRIDIFLHRQSQYQALDAFTLGLQKGLERAGVVTRLHEIKDKDPSHFIKSVQEDRPDCTLSFNGLLPDREGRFLCDLLNLPHIACLVDSPSWFIPLKESPLTYKACCDRSHVEFFQQLGDPHAFFMTQGCDKELSLDPALGKKYDVVLLASCIDIESIEENWKKLFSEPMVRTLLHAVDIALRDPKVSYWQAFSEAINAHHPQDPLDLVTMVELLKDLELYINGKDRIDLLKNLTGVTIDVFGDRGGPGSWSHYLKECPHIRLHPPVSFEEHYKILQQSKILLNSLAKVRQGGNERVFNGYLLGALSVSSENHYLKEFYQEGDSILYYRWGSWRALEQKILEILNTLSRYDRLVEKGREITLATQTWDHRAKELLNLF